MGLEDLTLHDRVHGKVREAYETLTAMLENPAQHANPLASMLGFSHVVMALKDALSLLEGDG